MWFFDRVAAGEVIVIEHGGEAIAALHPCAG
jgi:antitoxin (DNA-binding transcriptional repressor) of toxin-antitoxin stability system